MGMGAAHRPLKVLTSPRRCSILMSSIFDFIERLRLTIWEILDVARECGLAGMNAALPNGRKQSSSLRMRQTKSELKIAIAGGDHALLNLDAIHAEATTLKAQDIR